MAIVKRPPESGNRSLWPEKPVNQLPYDYCKFVDHTPDYVTNLALGKTRARDPEDRKCGASSNGPGPVPVEGIVKRSR